MSPRPLKLLALTVLAALAAGCPKAPPPVPPPAPVVEAPPPPPPECEAFSEKCAAKGDTRAKITGSTLLFTPAPGWIYAQQSSSTVAQVSDAGPAIAFLGVEFPAKDVKKEVAAKEAALAELFKQIGLSPFKQKIPWKSPPNKDTYDTVKVEFWQFENEKGIRNGEKGVLLFVVAHVTDGNAVVGVAYQPDKDTSSADLVILNSIKSLGPAK